MNNRNSIITKLILLLNLIVFAIMVYKGVDYYKPTGESIIDRGGNYDAFIINGEWWRLISAMFIHAGVFHLAFNMVALYSIGKIYETNAGSLQMFLVYLLSGIIGNITSCWLHPFQVSCGASGAIFGIAGAAFAKSFLDSENKFSISQHASFITFLILNLVLNLSIKEFDWAAHLGGLISGFLIIFLFETISKSNSSKTSFLVSYSIVLFITGLLMFAFYFNCNYRYGYFAMFQSFIANDNETLNILNNPVAFKNRFVSKTNIKSADDIWKTNLKMLTLFKNVPEDLYDDIVMLKWYIHYRRQSLIYLTRYIDTDELVYLDSIDQTIAEINSLPEIKYKIGYHLDDDDTLNVQPQLIKFVEYYDSSWQVINKAAHAVFYRHGAKDSIGNVNGLIHDYYRSGMIQMKGRYERSLKNGAFFYYNENGTYSSYGSYRMDEIVGIWNYFYDDGKHKYVWNYLSDKELLLSYWDNNGDSLITDGNGLFYNKHKNGLIAETGNYKNGLKNGLWKGFYENGKPFFLEKYTDGKLIFGESIDANGNRFRYNKEWENVTPLNLQKDESYIEYLARNIQYPVRALANKISGIVIMQFEIDTNGSAGQFVPVSKLGFGCEEEAIRVIRDGTKFNAAKHRGIKVSVTQKVPVVFSLKK